MKINAPANLSPEDACEWHRRFVGPIPTEKPLFIPLKREFFEAFANGTKTEEIRVFGKTWSEKNCRIGRPVVLSLGYGTKRRLSGHVAGFRVSFTETLTEAWQKCYPTKIALAACIHIHIDR